MVRRDPFGDGEPITITLTVAEWAAITHDLQYVWRLAEAPMGAVPPGRWEPRMPIVETIWARISEGETPDPRPTVERPA